MVANARGPETLEDLVRETGATASSTGELPADADVVVLAIPFAAIPDLPPLPRGAVVAEAATYVPGMRDPEIPSSRPANRDHVDRRAARPARRQGA